MDNKPLNGVKCVVTSCFYNKDGNKCMAEQILVEPKHATTSNETDCSTFRPK